MRIIDMPLRGIHKTIFEPLRFDAGAPERGGRMGGVTLGFPVWEAQWMLVNDMTEQASEEWRAFLIRLRGSQRYFYGFDHKRRFPRTYPDGFDGMTRAGGGAFPGSATSWSQTIDSHDDALVTLNGLPAGLVIQVGDYIGFKWDAAGSAVGSFDRRTVVRLVENTTASGAGVAIANVEPPVNVQAVPSFAIAHLDEPRCLMRSVPDQSQLGSIGPLLNIAGGSISAVQDLRP